MTTGNVIDLSQPKSKFIEPQKGMNPLVKIALILIIIAVSLYIFGILEQGYRCIRLVGVWC